MKIFFVSVIFFCSLQVINRPSSLVLQIAKPAIKQDIINSSGTTILSRFNTPDGFVRVPAEGNSFASYLRNLPLKPAGSKVKYYYGGVKEEDVYDGVVDMDIGDKDLQQCAD